MKNILKTTFVNDILRSRELNMKILKILKILAPGLIVLFATKVLKVDDGILFVLMFYIFLFFGKREDI